MRRRGSVCEPSAPPISESQQAKLLQLPAQCLRHVLGARCYPIKITRRFLRSEIPPALKRPPGPRLDQHELGLEHQITPTDSRLVNERAHIDEPLAAKNPTTDHPVKRAALAQLVGTLWHHARAMHVLARQSAPLARFEACANPLSEVFDRIAANAKLDEMERHRMPRAWPPTLPSPACGGGIKGGGCRAGS